MNAIIYGSGVTGKQIYHNINNKGAAIWNAQLSTRWVALHGGFMSPPPHKMNAVDIIAFTDSNPSFWGTKLFDLPVIAPEQLNDWSFDKIIVGSLMAYETITNRLLKLGIPREKIDTSYVETTTINRDKFLNSFAQIVYDRNLPGNVAECGVNEGVFAKKINVAFSDRKIYLFDTFEGFDKRDIAVETANNFSVFGTGHLKIDTTNEEYVKSILPHSDNAIIRKGYFPETAEGIDDEFVFVNLDFDLYKPTVAGLEFFWSKMVRGGVIIVHDFFNDGYKGIKPACDEFCEKYGTAYIPIGDEMSVAFTKY